MMIVAAMLSVENIHSDQGSQTNNKYGGRRDQDEGRTFTSILVKDSPGDHIYFLKVFQEWISCGGSKGEEALLLPPSHDHFVLGEINCAMRSLHEMC